MPSTIELPEVEEQLDYKLKYQPPYHVILMNDDDHSYAYVITMLQELFGYEVEKGYLLNDKVIRFAKVVVGS